MQACDRREGDTREGDCSAAPAYGMLHADGKAFKDKTQALSSSKRVEA